MEKETTFFDKLKKMFSTQAVIKVDASGKRHVVDTDNRQINTNLLSLRDRYTKLHRSFYEQQQGAHSMAYQQIRRELFRDYDSMDNDAILSSALDIYADESSTKNEFGDVLKITSPNETVSDMLHNLFYDIMNVEFNLWPWIRNMCKYGDFFLALEIAEEVGIVNVVPHSVYDTERIEGSDPTNRNYVKFKVENDAIGKAEYENYEMAHFRLLADTNFLPYGKAMLENARRGWKQLTLMEDAMLIHRIMRAPEKRIFKIDIGNIKPTEIDNYMQKIISKMKKVPFLDKKTGQYNLRYNMQNLTEDFFLPVRGSDSGTEIDTLSGLDYAAIEDIDYLKDKMFAALKIPRAYLSYEEDLCIDPNTKIPLLSGETKTAKQLIEDYQNGIKNYVYSLDEETNNIVPGEIEWAGMTREDAKVVKVWLDNGKYIICTPDHEFLKRNGEWVVASELNEDDSLMPLALENTSFMNNFTPCIKNHKVSKVEFLEQHIDTCDIRVSKYHNFGTDAGIIIHNSGKATLAAEDVRFARTIERIQRTVVSELTKIAVVHLYSCGITDVEMVNFQLSLTNPSTIYEQEKINLWSEKVRLASDLKDLKLVSYDWIYDNVLGMSDADRDEEKEKVIQDTKHAFRLETIERDGEDPAVAPQPTDIEEELNNLTNELKNKGGRPREGNTYGKDKHPYGRDPLGNEENEKERKRDRRDDFIKNKNARRIAREHKLEKKIELIKEKKSKSMLDDSNIINDNI